MDTNREIQKVHLVYFSGTGGTARVATSFQKSFQSRDIEVTMESLDEPQIQPDILIKTNYCIDLVIILYPVHAFDAPEPIYNYLDKLPKVSGLPAVVISVSGGGEVWVNNACRVGCIKRLCQKGYEVIYERMLVMPSNFVVATEEQLAVQLLKVLPTKVEGCISEILTGVIRRKRPAFVSRLMTILFKLEKPAARLFAKTLKVREHCTACGWCVHHCPRKNILIKNGQILFGWKCIMCFRCIYGCPQTALYTRIFHFLIINEGYNLVQLEKQHSILADLEVLEEGDFFFKGVLDYLKEDDFIL